MNIKKGQPRDREKAIKIAKELREWFRREAIENMKLDFEVNHLIVAVEGKEVVGFLCYSSKEGILHINWIGVAKDKQGLGIGEKLLKRLEKEGKSKGFKAIEVETLTDKENYKPYERTREFYNKMGFKKVCEVPKRRKNWDAQILMEKEVEQ